MSLEQLKAELSKALAGFQGSIAYAIYDGDGCIAMNAGQRMKAASTIKLPLLLMAFRLYEQGRLDIHREIPFTDLDIVPGSGVLQSMKQRSIRLEDALSLMITVSDNTATNLVIDAIGLDRCKDGFRDIGLKTASLQRKMMDYEGREAGKENWISAEDLIVSLKRIQNEGSFSEESRKAMREMLINQQFRDKLPYLIDENLIAVANKTGEIEGVENDCAIFFYKNHVLYAAVLCGNLKKEGEGQRIIRHIGDKIGKYLLAKDAM
ncbi:serine hydrolase [Bacillus testis]|uniref:serine hydrolase n=1 Tax=Bacillus testis TaxID=1622072 RepID=UPI00067E7379|nr:serine hydrolase [Bacillus testis]